MFSTYSIFVVIKFCIQGKTLCSPCTCFRFRKSATEVNPRSYIEMTIAEGAERKNIRKEYRLQLVAEKWEQNITLNFLLLRTTITLRSLYVWVGGGGGFGLVVLGGGTGDGWGSGTKQQPAAHASAETKLSPVRGGHMRRAIYSRLIDTKIVLFDR